MRKLFEENSTSKKILSLIYMNGELPYKALHVIGVSNVSAQKSARKMIKQGYVVKEAPLYGKQTLLLGPTKPEMEPFYKATETYESRKPLLYYKGGSKDSYTKRRRNMMIAETTAFLLEGNVQVFPDEKPVFGEEKILEWNVCMYTPAEIKKRMDSMEARASATRATAVLVSHYEFSMVYFLDAKKMHFSTIVERTSRDRIEYVLNQYSEYRDTHSKKALMETAYLLTRDTGFLTDIIVGERTRKGLPFIIDTSFRQYFFLPYTREGVRMFRMIHTEEKREILYRLVMKSSERTARTGSFVDCDGIKEDGTIIYDYMVPELLRLRRIISFITKNIRSGTQVNYVVFCYDFQIAELEELFKEYGIDRPNILAYSIDTVEKLFLKEDEHGE